MRYYFLAFISLLSIAISCDSDEISSYNVGSEFLENEININVLDTFSIKSSTYKFDSIVTSSEGRVLLGHIEDEFIGKTTSSSYFQLSTSNFSIDADATYDSIGFVLNYDNYYYRDTTVAQTYKVYKLAESVSSDNDDDNFYNTSTIDFDEMDLLGQSKAFTPRPNRANDSIYISLLDVGFGETIFNEIQEGNISTEDEFLSEYKGLLIAPDNTINSHILGFNAQAIENIANNSSLRLYYSNNNDSDGEFHEDELTYLDFVILDGAKQFNNISSDLTGTKIEGLGVAENETSDQVYSSDTNNQTVIQAGSGICSKFEIPGIDNIKKLSEYGSTLNAELIFNPSPGTFNEDYPLPQQLTVYIVDRNNEILEQLVDVDGIETFAELTRKNEFAEGTFYTVDVTAFVEAILASDQDLNYGLMFQMPEYTKVVDRVILDDSSAENSQLKLTVKYLNY